MKNFFLIKITKQLSIAQTLGMAQNTIYIRGFYQKIKMLLEDVMIELYHKYSLFFQTLPHGACTAISILYKHLHIQNPFLIISCVEHHTLFLSVRTRMMQPAPPLAYTCKCKGGTFERTNTNQSNWEDQVIIYMYKLL